MHNLTLKPLMKAIKASLELYKNLNENDLIEKGYISQDDNDGTIRVKPSSNNIRIDDVVIDSKDFELRISGVINLKKGKT